MNSNPQFDHTLFDFCGQHCVTCMVHKMKKKACENCSGNCAGKIDRVMKCGVRICAGVRDNNFCKDCEKYPCKKILQMNEKYAVVE